MRTTPDAHRTRSHARLLDEMAHHARSRTRDAPRPWDPTRPATAGSPDLGRGLLDCFALALHVLWTYQEAWAAEGFLPTARLVDSTRRLLELIGHRPDAGTAATGLQHFRCREGEQATIPAGFRVRAAPDGEREAAVYETLRAVRIRPELNELRPFLPVSAAPTVDTTGSIAEAALLSGASVPRVDGPLGGGSLVDQLRERLAAARTGTLDQRRAAQARQKALRVAEVMADLAEHGDLSDCGDAFDGLCGELCEDLARANETPQDTRPGPLSASQELLAQQLRALDERQPGVIGSLAVALGRQDGESATDWSRRLDQVTTFLDALVAGILQDARDQVVRLHGSRALSRLDRSLASGDRDDRGVAAPGADALYVASVPGDDGAGPQTFATLIRPGDWLVVAEDDEAAAADAGAGDRDRGPVTRRHREAVKVVRVRDEIPPGRGEPATRITFSPPLTRRYRLSRTVLIGNVVEISHGATVTERRIRAAGDGRFVSLTSGPLTWLRSAEPAAADGRTAEAELTVAGRRWTRVASLRDQPPDAAVFTAEVTPEGGARLRVGDGITGAAVPVGAELALRYRAGLGADGNRPAAAVDALASAHPAVAETVNPLAITGGTDAEDPVRARLRAAAGIATLERAVSADDVRGLTLGFGGVRDAAVLRDPVRRRRRLTVVVLPDDDDAFDDAERARLRAFLLARTPPGTSIGVVPATLVGLRLRLRVDVEPGADPLAVLADVRARLGVDEADEPGLLDPSRARLGRDVNLSDVYGALADVDRSPSALVEALHRDDAPPGRGDRVAVGAREAAVWASPSPGVEAVEIAWREAVDR